MKDSKYKFFIFMNLMILFNPLNSHYLAQTQKKSIIKLLCIQNVKDQMFNAKIEYSEKIANETCECYFKEFTETASHQDAITKCKLKTKENLNHNRKI